MSRLETPTKADNEILRITRDLSAKWGLRFPKFGPRSPSARKTEQPEEKVLLRLQFLYFHDQRNNQAATSYGIGCFEQMAPRLLAGWIPKPSADADVLPSRTRSETARQGAYLSKKPTLSDEQSADLMQTLLGYLIDVCESIRKGAIFPKDPDPPQKVAHDAGIRNETSEGLEPRSIPRSSRTLSEKSKRRSTNLNKNGNIRNYLQQKSNDLLQPPDFQIKKVPQCSSDDYKVDDELFNDVEMQDATDDAAPPAPIAKRKVSERSATSSESITSLEEQYQTPPDSPSKVGTTERTHQTENGRMSPTPGAAQINSSHSTSKCSPGQSRKRTYPAMSKPEMPRKMSRDSSKSRATGWSSVQAFDALAHVGAPIVRNTSSDARVSSDWLHRSFSSTSFTSVSSAAATKASSAWTTPNTSFLTETSANSFDSCSEPLELDDKSLQTRRSWQNPKAPYGLGLGLGLDMEVDTTSDLPAKVGSMGPPLLVPMTKKPPEVLVEHLLSVSPFDASCPRTTDIVGFRQLYELCRVSTQTRIPLEAFSQSMNQTYDDYDALWSKLTAVAKERDSALPGRSSLVAWKQSEESFKGVALTGSLKFIEQPGNQLFEFRLNPLKIERTYRLARQFGYSRFFVLSIPSLDTKNLPLHVRGDPKAREVIVNWLVKSEHSFLGRRWRAFYVKPEDRKAGTTSPVGLNHSKFRVYLFAESGNDFQVHHKDGERDPRISNHQPKQRSELIEWLMPAKVNREQRALKFFSRLAIGQLTILCSLQLDYTPSIFQGRIAGAKGVWMVDALDENIGGYKGDIWIEITDSQLKFEAGPRDNLYPETERVTFEVLAYSKTLTQANLNFQLMPILAEQQVPFKVFCDLLEADLSARVAELEIAMESGLTIRKWNQDVNSVISGRAADGVELHGGMPSKLTEKINWFVENGFEPQSCCRLKDHLYSAIKDYCLRLENRMNIGVAKSTYAFMIADPLAVLEEGEVHIGFSTPFDHEMMLHDIDLLVARLPAALPSDIQKVRATFKIELKSYRDVIVFSSKGSISLAEKLSGWAIHSARATIIQQLTSTRGDYDGDKAWICWEPSIVDPFINAPLPEATPLGTYGIEEEKTLVSDLLLHDDYMDRFLCHAFDFNLQSSLLGICTSFFEALCYRENNIAHPSAIKIGQLLGKLVDRAKAGFIFDDEKWADFLKKEGLPKLLPKPAYKDKEKGVPKKGNLIDRLVFETAKGVREKALGDFSRRFQNVGTFDTDIVTVYKRDCEYAKRDKGIARALADLKCDLQMIKDFWSMNCMRIDDVGNEETSALVGRPRRKSSIPFQAVAERVRDDFLSLRPSAEARALSPVVEMWDWECQCSSTSTPPSSPPLNHWTLLKASMLFYHYHEKNFIWYAAGPELGLLKSQASGLESFRSVRGNIWECFKLDGKAVARNRRKAEEDQGINVEAQRFDDDGEVDEYGDWGWVEGVDV
ncbi:MAG: hypothetical protein Q9223_003832 [Gallowayella weberi]